MIFGLKAKAAVAVLTVAIAFGSGWVVKGKFEDSKELASIKAQNALAAEIREGQAEISKQVEDRLGELRANERVIDRGVIREIQKPIYQRICLPDAAIRLLNAAAAGEAPREPDDQSSREASPTD